MGRRKIEIKAIKDDRNRSVTFLKRKNGLFKKAHELAVLCSVDVAVIIFGHNKKLYEFSSSDIREILGRYQYFGPAHEHKGPEDFSGKRDGDEDDEEEENTPVPEEVAPSSNIPVVPAHFQSQPVFQQIGQPQSVSPPVVNGVSYTLRHATPQSQGGSRPTSRNHIRHVSANIAPQQHHHATPPPPQNGFTYPNPSMYNPHPNPSLAQQSLRSGQFTHYGPQAPQHRAGPSTNPHRAMPEAIAQQHQLAQHQISHNAPLPHGLPPQSQPSHVTQAYMQEQARNSMAPAFSSQHPQQPSQQQEQDGHRVTVANNSSLNHVSAQSKRESSESPQPQRSLSSKSRSIFTPIDDRGSVLARHFGVGPHMRESPINELVPKSDSPPYDLNDGDRSAVSAIRTTVASTVTGMSRTQSVPAGPRVQPAVRTTSGQGSSKRPQLKVQIPSESSDRSSVTAESGSSTGQKISTPAKTGLDGNQPGVVLPPPSPSTGAVLSAGASGPPNPFARPPPPGTTAQNNSAYNNNNNIETPVSALPSRFVSDALLPSPSSFFPEWGFGKASAGPDANMLPSPLTFPTPAVATGPTFSRDDEFDKKRKSPESGTPLDGTPKKAKT